MISSKYLLKRNKQLPIKVTIYLLIKCITGYSNYLHLPTSNLANIEFGLRLQRFFPRNDEGIHSWEACNRFGYGIEYIV